MDSQIYRELYSTIKDTELWESQRDVNVNLVQNIVDSQLKFFEKHAVFIIPVPIVFVNFKGDMYILDGQHRVRACKILYEEYKHDVTLSIVTYECNKKSDIDELYAMINNINTNNCMIEENKITDDGHKIKEIHILLREKYGDQIWDDKRKMKPYVNINILDEELKNSGLLKSKTPKEIIKAIQKHNDQYKKTLSKANKDEIDKYGGFCLQYREAKARWVRTLF